MSYTEETVRRTLDIVRLIKTITNVTEIINDMQSRQVLTEPPRELVVQIQALNRRLNSQFETPPDTISELDLKLNETHRANYVVKDKVANWLLSQQNMINGTTVTVIRFLSGAASNTTIPNHDIKNYVNFYINTVVTSLIMQRWPDFELRKLV